MWPCLGHTTCVVVCRHTRQMVPPARILQQFSPHTTQSDCRFGEGPKSGPRPPPTCAIELYYLRVPRSLRNLSRFPPFLIPDKAVAY